MTGVDARYVAAKSALRDIELSPEAFARALRRCPDARSVNDLYLAQAVLEKSPTAIAHLHKKIWPAVERALRAQKLSNADVEELSASVFESVVFGKGGYPPKLIQYVARGALDSWAVAVGVRAAIDHLRASNKFDAGDDALEQRVDLAASAVDTSLLKTQFVKPFREAFHEALGKLDDKERLLLRQQYLDGMSGQDLCRVHGVHRATLQRWLADARLSLLTHLKALLAQKMAVSASEAGEVFDLIHSRLDLSLSMLLRDDA